MTRLDPPETDSRLVYYGHEAAFWLVAVVLLPAIAAFMFHDWLRRRRSER